MARLIERSFEPSFREIKRADGEATNVFLLLSCSPNDPRETIQTLLNAFPLNLPVFLTLKLLRKLENVIRIVVTYMQMES